MLMSAVLSATQACGILEAAAMTAPSSLAVAVRLGSTAQSNTVLPLGWLIAGACSNVSAFATENEHATTAHLNCVFGHFFTC